MRKTTSIGIAFVVALITALLFIFFVYVQPVQSPDTGATPTPHKNSEKVTVDSIDIIFLESWPVQILAKIDGELADSCTLIDAIVPERTAFDTFEIYFNTSRVTETDCSSSAVAFSKDVGLDVYGLPAGVYTVKAGETSTTFTFDTDNGPSIDSLEVTGEITDLLGVNNKYTGTAHRNYTQKIFSLSVDADLPTPPVDKFYEGWLVRPEPNFDSVSTGKLVPRSKSYSLTFSSSIDYSEYINVVITEETLANGLDNKPELHVLEGSFK